MHMIIRNIVYAEKPQEALQKAKDNMGFMIGDDGNAPFDYYSTFDEGGTNYWGSKYPSVAKLGTKMGRKLVCDGWRYTLNEIRDHYLLSEMLLLRRGMRLSVQPISQEHYEIICHLGRIHKI